MRLHYQFWSLNVITLGKVAVPLSSSSVEIVAVLAALRDVHATILSVVSAEVP